MKEKQVEALAATGVHMGNSLRGTVEQTHISWVILTPRFAFKIKKPLKLSFLDFSTLGRRKKFCEKELSLNRRFSSIYLAVLPIRLHHGVWSIGGKGGKIVDYTVQMKRMESSKRMDIVLRARHVDGADMLRLARSVSSFHMRAEVVTAPFKVALARKAFNDIWVINDFVARELASRYLTIISRSIAWSNTFLTLHCRRFQDRIREGFKRDVHGDLHSGNIFLYKRPVIFDCIEFNDSFRQVDLVDEIAFLCMDLEAHGRKYLASQFVSAYTRHLQCFTAPDDRKIFIYFKCYRANVRAKVLAVAAMQERDAAARRKRTVEVKKYLDLMERYMTEEQRMNTPAA